jgi:NAD-dependent deacetylase
MNVTIFTGAGVSAESGVPTFRDADGLWKEFDPNIVSSVGGWEENLQMFMGFWDNAKGYLESQEFKPNKAHDIIAEWERKCLSQGGKFSLITTNVDNLHEVAGSSDPIKIHGDIMSRGRELEYEIDGHPFSWHMPDVVLFGDMKKRQEDMWRAVREADLFVVIGSSLSIGGDSAIIYNAKDQGAKTVEINPNPTGHPAFDMVIPKPATIGVSEIYTMMAA